MASHGERSESLPGKKILVVDDDHFIVDYLCTILEDAGYQICKALDAEQALQVALDEKPDLVTLDLEMPAGGGPRFYRELADDHEHPSVPIIVISGIPNMHLAIPNAYATIAKPFDPQRVLQLVHEALTAAQVE
jgi:CheY-like chemotaxis protein